MLEGKSAEELRAVAHAGGGMEINGNHFSTDELRAIAHAVAGSKASYLVIHNSKSKSTEDLRAIAHAAPGKTIFA